MSETDSTEENPMPEDPPILLIQRPKGLPGEQISAELDKEMEEPSNYDQEIQRLMDYVNRDRDKQMILDVMLEMIAPPGLQL